ncbi:hypothetical protein [Halarsenatibacter silvermanii]|uniref:Uncharacterized protein n=1 Tax=Halarsenatibacter silvermanii TaxID=321763 RepID=A0A1G9IW71_9FIRM|nr:hypothetical protein [Halarsenatibacter silvermanii]SDL29295.1 hypothetical protein SAMN04488692_10375 [Halarsenatibacter silvermanii]
MLRSVSTFFLIFTAFWYIIYSRNILDMGKQYPSRSAALLGAIMTSLLASGIYLVLMFFMG